MNTGSLSYASEVDNKASEIVGNEIHTNKERISNMDTAVQENEDNKADDTIENQNNNPENQKSNLKKEASLATELPISAPLLEKDNSKNDTQVKEVNKADKQLNNQIYSEESPKQVIQENKDNQAEQHNDKNNNHIKDSKTEEVSNYHETELINKEDNLKADGTGDNNKVVISQNENRQKVRRKRNVLNPSNDNNITSGAYNRNANQMNIDVSSDGTMTYQWYPVIGGLSSQERFWITNGYGDNENRARKKATMLWLISNFDFTKEQRQSFKIQDLNSPLFGDDVYKWLEEAKKGNIIPKQGTMNLGRRNEMIISANNIILSDNKGFDRGIINFGDTRNFTPSDSDDVNNITITSSDIDFGFTLKPPFEKIGVDNTWAVSENEKEEIKSAIRKANSNINFVNINVSYNGTVFAQALNNSGEIVDSADLNANTVIIDKIFIEKKEKLDTLISLVENTKLLDETLYTPASINFLQRELNYTSIVIRDSYDPELNTIPDIISATNRLDYAIKSLVRRANVTELQNAISNAKTQGPFDNNIEEDRAIISALEVGENTVKNENTPQDVVDTVTTNINNALRERLQAKNLLQDVEALVNEAEEKNRNASNMLVTALTDGIISNNENDVLTQLVNSANNKKAEAQDKINLLPDSKKAPFQNRIDSLPTISIPAVNDADNNGIADDKDQAKAQAESKVSEAEAADQAAKAKLAEYQQDGLITTPEKADLDNLATTAQTAKTEAQGLVDALPDVLKGDLPTRLNNLTGIQVPEVNDADGNGIADDKDRAQAENKVTEAEAADQTAKTKLVEYQEDGLITEPEKVDLENLAATAQSKKTEAQVLVDALPDGLKGDLATRLNNLTSIQVPAVNDADDNGIADDVDQAKAQAESKVTEAEAADQVAKAKLSEYQQDGLITTPEKKDLENLAATAQSKKAEAQRLVDALPDVLKGDLATRLNNLTGIQVPAVNDADGNGIADDVDQAKAQAGSKVSEAEAADQAAKAKLTEYQQDGLITAPEKVDLDNLVATAQTAKTEAQGLVDALPDVLKGDLATRLNNLTGIQVPAVNDADDNGIADDVDQAKAQAESKVSEAEAADQAAKTKLGEYQQDGLITTPEKTDLENLAATAQNKKAEAQVLVDALPDVLKNDLVTRLNNLTGIQVPVVNDADGNGIADDVDQAKAQAESKVSEAEAADQAAKTKLTEYQQDGLITASEKADLDNLVATAQSKKAEAQGLVDALPGGLKNDLVTRLNNLTGIQVPAVNDADGNGIADDVDQAKAQAESKVSEAEAADQAAKTKLVEYQQDGLITEPEKADLDSLAATAQSKKAEAQGLVDALPDGMKNDLVTRLNNLTGIQVPVVNDADGNGVADDVDQAKAQAGSKVSEAEAADQAAKTKLVEYQQDGLITEPEKADLDSLAATAQSKKAEAQGLVDVLPDGMKNDLSTRLNNLTGIQIPAVNDADDNGVADDVDQAKAQAESKVSEAEAADQAAKTKLAEYQQDGLITTPEKSDLDSLAATAQTAKTEAQGLVDALPDVLKGDLATRLNNLTGIQVPAVNDADGNGVADDVDQAKAQAESKVSEAEAADQAAKTKLTEYQQDGLITASEKADLDNLATTAQTAKTEAQGLVDALPDVLKGDLATRLNNLTGIQVPAVNDADGNGIADVVDQAKAQAESKVTEAEASYQAAKAKLSEYQQDGLITITEREEIEELIVLAEKVKREAQKLVDALAESDKGDLSKRLDNLAYIQLPLINDADGNGIADDIDSEILKAENSVIKAEVADKTVKDKLTEYQQDGLVSSNEKRELINLLTKAQRAKAEAQVLVDALSSEFRGDLPSRLNKLTGIEIPKVNDADNDGKKDDVDELKALVETKVQEAEAAHQNALAKLTEYQQDGLIKQWEKNDILNLSHEVFSKKARAFALVDGLPKEQQGEFLNRLNKLTDLPIPEINDKNNNGIADDVDQAKAQAESKVTEAEAADQAAKTKLTEYQQDGLITEPEKADLDNLATTAQTAKTEAQGLVDALPDVLKGDLPTRLNNLTGIQVPEVNDADGNGIADDKDRAQAENKVTEAEAADQTAKTKLVEYQEDGLITEPEKVDLENLAATAQSKKTEAQVLVDALPDGLKGDLATRLNNLTGIQVPALNDADGNGIADDVDQAKAQAESKVSEAEAADQAAKEKLVEYQQDGLITEPEKVDLDNLVATAQTAKTEAQVLVDALPDGLKGDMSTRLNNLTGIQVPAVNDADGNGIADDVDQSKAQAESKVTEAEAADQAAKTKLTEYQEDGLITASEKAELDNLATTAQSKKAEAQGLVDALPDVLKGDLATRLNNLTGIQVPAVNDADGNGIADDIDQAKAQAESKVTEAEAADQVAKIKLSEYQQDGLITTPEKKDLENLAATAQSKKAEAQRLVDALPDVLKDDLATRLNNLTGIQVPAVNDADGNGIADDKNQAKAQAESKVTEAEVADQAAKTKLSEYQQDGLITASEKADLENLAATAQSKKAEAQKLVDALPNDVKEALQNRLNKLEGIVVPSVSVNSHNGQSNSHNMQGKDDINKNKDTLQKSPALSSNLQKPLNSKFDTSNDASNDMKVTHMSTANNESINTNKLSINSDNTKRGKSNNVKVLSPSKVDGTKKIDAKTLPNTGEEATKDTTLFGVLLASIGSLMVWRSRKKENTKETK
ncbi:LPXTG cell wall anchor domain-containing protein [Staphylococcus xylosus]|uniref:LPXTG cell wall anchor domain-containing protein n=2 Tax=Staphylococcus xylosus TaxID=1288 RepID=UPI001F541401|nr:LPXTG cell wall anchor domain-containing protein [Staphylococcus xylosus]